jgi:hypothetical protein
MTIIVGTDIVIHLAMEIIHFTDEREREEKEFLREGPPEYRPYRLRKIYRF